MGIHWFASIALAITGTLVSAAYGLTPPWAAGVGLIIFGIYWGVLGLCIVFDAPNPFDEFD